MKSRFLMVGLAVVLLFISLPSPASLARGYQHDSRADQVPLGYWLTHRAYQCGVAFWDWRPHYGAFFSGLYGYDQTYYGEGDPGDISTWDWYPPSPGDRNMLLIDGTFYWSHITARDPDNWEATTYMN